VPVSLALLERGRVGVAVASLAMIAGCSAAPGPTERQAIVPPEPVVDEVSADPSIEAPSEGPLVAVAYDITSASSITVVVTKRRPLSPSSYVPSELVALSGIPGGSGHQMRKEAAAAMTRMYEGADAAGVPFRISTAYRSYGFQQNLHSREVTQKGLAAADSLVARPGYSEHQTGLTADVYDVPANELNQRFGESGAGVWIRDHAHEYGFIVSYPDGSQSVTGYVYEPWHVRYVGEGVAADMHETGVATLQEYFDVEDSPTYE